MIYSRNTLIQYLIQYKISPENSVIFISLEISLNKGLNFSKI